VLRFTDRCRRAGYKSRGEREKRNTAGAQLLAPAQEKELAMLAAHLGLMRAMLKLPKPWAAWLGLLVALNAVAPLFFIRSPEAWAALAAVMVGMAIMTAIFAARGFVRLLGLGHAPWLLLLPWLLWSRLDLHEPGSALRNWLLALLIANSLSLVIDAVDVFRYIRGERAPTVNPKD
jgi:hypothetical protein